MSKLSLDRVLQSQGFGTRKYCRALIEDGDVAINGEVHDNYKTAVETDGLVLTVFDEEWVYRERVYILLTNGAPLELMRRHKVEMFFDQDASLTTRFGITRVPSVVEREGRSLRISEVRP